MPELLFSLMPDTSASLSPSPTSYSPTTAITPDYSHMSAPKTPCHTPLNDITNTLTHTPHTPHCTTHSLTHSTPRTQPEDPSLTPEADDLIRAPCKQTLSPEDISKPTKLSRKHLKFEDGVSLQSIILSPKDKTTLSQDVFDSHVNGNPFCEKKDNSFVPLVPQSDNSNRKSKSKSSRGSGKGKKRFDKTKNQKSAHDGKENFCHITPQKKNMPLLYGSDVTLESPDPMSKYNSANQKSSDLQQVAVAVAQKKSRISVLLQNCKQDATDQSRQVPKLNLQSVASIRAEASKFILDEKKQQQQQQQFDNKYQIHVSPDAITDDIYDFDTRKSQSHYKQEADSCKYPMCNDSLALESTPPLQKMSDDEESLLTSRVHAARHKSIRIVEKNMTRRSLSPSLNTLERQLQQKDSSISSPQMMPCSRSLDTLHPHTPNSEEESVRNAFKPTPPSRPQGIRVTFTRKSPQPPSTSSPKFQSQGNVMATPPGANRENLEANIRHARGRRYTNPVSPVVEETKEDINSPLANISTRPMPSRPTSNSHRRRPQPSSPTQPTNVQIEYSIKSPERLKKSLSEATSVSVSPLRPTDIPHPSPKRKKGDRVVSVSGLSKELLVSLITAAGKKRRRRNKNQPAFSIQLEQIPEDNFIDLSFPSWIAIATNSTSQQGHMEKKLPVEKSAERLFAESEYLEWLKSQVVVKQLNDQDTSDIETDSGSNKIDFLMRSIQNQDNEQFKSLLNENKNLIYCRDQNGNTALVAATLFGWKRGIKNLIKRGADLDAQNRFGNTSLHYASAIEDHHEIKRYLIRKQASTTIRNERGVCSCDSIQ